MRVKIGDQEIEVPEEGIEFVDLPGKPTIRYEFREWFPGTWRHHIIFNASNSLTVPGWRVMDEQGERITIAMWDD